MSHRNENQREALEVVRRLSALQQEKEQAVARQEFERAVELRESEVACRSRLQEFAFPTYVLANLQRHADGPATRLSPLLDLLATTPGAADPQIVERWPADIGSPICVAFSQIPDSAAGTLQAALRVDDVFSRHFEAVLPVLSDETLAKIRPDRRGEALRAMSHELDRSRQRCVPTVLSLVAPTKLLDAMLQAELFRGLKETTCDFVIFEQPPAIAGIARTLLPEITLIEA